MVGDIYAAGEDHQWSSSDSWTQELQTAYWDLMKQTWKDDNQAIVDYVFNNYLGYSQDYFGMSGEEIAANEGLKVAYGMVMWGFGSRNEDGSFTTAAGKTYDLVNDFPTIDDYYESTYQAYEGDRKLILLPKPLTTPTFAALPTPHSSFSTVLRTGDGRSRRS